MLYAMLAACAALIFVLVLAVPHAAKAHRLTRLFRAQEKWARPMDRHEETELYPHLIIDRSTHSN